MFKPVAFEKDQRNLGTWFVTDPVSTEAVVVSRSDLELSVLHGFTCCNFYVAKVGGRVGRNSNRYCLGYFLQAGLVFAKTPDHYIPNFGHKKAAMFGLQLARLIEFLRSAGNSTPGDRRVNWKNSLGGMRRIGESMRHEFSEGVRRKIAQRAMYIVPILHVCALLATTTARGSLDLLQKAPISKLPARMGRVRVLARRAQQARRKTASGSAGFVMPWLIKIPRDIQRAC